MSNVEQKIKEAGLIADALKLDGDKRALYIKTVLEKFAPEMAETIHTKQTGSILHDKTLPTSGWITEKKLNIRVSKIMQDCIEEGIVVKREKVVSKKRYPYMAISEDYINDQHISYGENRYSQENSKVTSIYWTEAGFNRLCELFGYGDLKRGQKNLI